MIEIHRAGFLGLSAFLCISVGFFGCDDETETTPTGSPTGTTTGTTTGTMTGTTTGTMTGTTTGTETGTTTGTTTGTMTGTPSGGVGGAGGAGGMVGGSGGVGGMVGGSGGVGGVGGGTGGGGFGGVGGAATTPDDLTGLVLWLDASVGVTLNGNHVSGWDDQSGRGNHAAQSTAVEQPLLNTGVFQGSFDAVDFDGSDDALIIADSSDLDPGTGSFLCMAAGQWITGSNYKVWFGKSGNTDASNWRLFRTSGQRLQVFWGDNTEYYPNSTGTVPGGGDILMAWGVDANTSEVIYVIDGTIERKSLSSGVQGVGSNSLDAVIGRDQEPAYRSNIRVAEQVFYKRTGGEGFADWELDVLINYFSTKYGL